jgi:glucose-1-phosphate adenylyltransferase
VSEAHWYQGTADAVHQNADIIADHGPRHIVLLAGDHIYKMDYEKMLAQHVETGADVTVCCMAVPRLEARGFGVMQVNSDGLIVDFVEKPADPPGIPGRPDMALASMGIYVFDTKFLLDQLKRDAADAESTHDFGKDLIPWIVRNGRAVAHRFERSCVRSSAEEAPYWRDVGTVDAYWEANIDLTDVVPGLDLYDRDWPIWTYAEITPPAKFVHDMDGRRGEAVASLVAGGCIVSGARARRSLLFTDVRLNSFASVDGAVLLPQVYVGRRARLKAIAQDKTKPVEDRFAATLKLAELPRNSSATRIRNRCEITGRPRGYYRKHKLSRIALRELGSKGLIPGLVKSSW